MNEPQWAPRVSMQKVHQLYQTDAKGIHDEALIDDVGYALLARCESIRIVSDAYRGRIVCPQCVTLITEEGPKPQKIKDQLLHCNACSWQMLSGDYHKTYQGKQLRGQNFEPELDYFLQHFPKAQTPAEKMICIDRLIHAVHKGTAKPAATNLLAGSAGQLVVFLDELAYGDKSTSGIKQTKAAWDDRLSAARHWGKAIRKRQQND